MWWRPRTYRHPSPFLQIHALRPGPSAKRSCSCTLLRMTQTAQRSNLLADRSVARLSAVKYRNTSVYAKIFYNPRTGCLIMQHVISTVRTKHYEVNINISKVFSWTETPMRFQHKKMRATPMRIEFQHNYDSSMFEPNLSCHLSL